MGRRRSRAWGRNERNVKSRGRIARVLPTRRLRLEVLEDRRLLSLVGVPPLGGLEWLTAATDEPADAGTGTEIAFSGEAGILTAAPATPDLLDISDTGVSNTDNLTNLDNSSPEKSLRFAVGNTIAGATVILYADGTLIGIAVAEGTTTAITTYGSFDLTDGPHAITARQIAPGEAPSADSTPLQVAIDTVAPLLDPVRLGGFDPGGNAYDVAVSGTLAYVVGNRIGLRIRDTNPAAPEWLGGYGSENAYGVAVCGTLAYVVDHNAGLLIFDVANPTAVVRTGGYDTDGTAYGVAVSGTLAYVADGDAGLQIIDVANPAAPVRLATYNTSGSARGVAVAGTLAYVADWSAGLQIIDVTNPAAPVRLGGYDTVGSAYGVAISETRAYVADGDAGLAIIDVGNPAAPVRLGGYDTPGTSHDVAVCETRAYVADASGGLQIIDAGNPAAPVRLGEYQTGGSAYGVTVAGALTYVAANISGVQILDAGLSPNLHSGSDTGISGTDNITGDNTPTFDLAVPAGSFFRVYRDGLQISGDYESGTSYTTTVQADGTYRYAFAAVDSAGNVSVSSAATSVTVDATILSAPDLSAISDTGVFDADNLTNLDNSQPEKSLEFLIRDTIAGATVTLYADGTPIGSAVAGGTTTTVTTNGDFRLAGGAHRITVRQTPSGRPESPDSAGMQVTIDAVAPLFLNPRRLGGYNYRAAFTVTLSGTLAYVTTDGLLILDVTNPAAPVRLGSYGAGYYHDVVVSGTLAYVADASYGLVVLDVSRPAMPVRLGAYHTDAEALRVALSGTLLYMTEERVGLHVFDVSNPAKPVRLGGYATGGYAVGVAVSGTLVYVADAYRGLLIFDMSNPAMPVLLGRYATGGYAFSVAVSGTLAYVADLNLGLLIFDVSDPAAPVRLGGYDTSGYAHSVTVSESLAYVADESGGLAILDVGNPAAPEWVGGCDTGGFTYDVAVSGARAYVADRTAGFTIIDVSALTSLQSPDLWTISDTGTSNTDNITNDSTPTFRQSIPAAWYFRVYRDGIQISGGYQHFMLYTTAVQADGTYGYTIAAVDAAGNVSEQSPPLAVTIDTTPPAVVEGGVNGGAAQRSQIASLAIRFGEEVSGSLDAADLTLVKRDSGAAVSLSGVTPTYGPFQ
ncbi:MAG: Ig-like domain-containing protein [Pirellulales bacterium]